MSNEPTDIHGPDSIMRTQTNVVAHCQVCGVQWQVRSANYEDAKGCTFCGAPESAISLVSEDPRTAGYPVTRDG